MWRASSGGKAGRRRPAVSTSTADAPAAPVVCCRCCSRRGLRRRSNILCHLLLVLAGVCAAAAPPGAGRSELFGAAAAGMPARPLSSLPSVIGEYPAGGRQVWRPSHGVPAEDVLIITKQRRGHPPKPPNLESATRSGNVPPSTGAPSDTTAPSAAETRQSGPPDSVAGQAGEGAKSSGAISEEVGSEKRAGDAQVVQDGQGTAEAAAESAGATSPSPSSTPSAAAANPSGTSTETSTSTTTTTTSSRAPDTQTETRQTTTDTSAPRETQPPKPTDVDVTYSCAAVSECEPCALSATEEECKATGYRQMVECRPMIQQDDGTTSTFPNPMSPPVIKEWRSCTLGKNAETVRFFVFQVINLLVAAASTFSVIRRRRQLNQYQYALLSRRINNA